MHEHDAFAARGRSSEEAYFRARDQGLVEKLKGVFESDLDKDSLRKAGVKSEEVLDRLVKLHVKGELLTAFKLFPLVEIAWADGAVDQAERAAVIHAATNSGIPRNSEVLKRLEEWLTQGPTPDGRTAWYMFAGELRKTLSRDELDHVRKALLDYCKSVAEASGGILGVAFQVSVKEKAVMDKVAKALTPD